MNNLEQDAEQAIMGGGGGGGNNNMGGNMEKEAMKDMSGGGGNQNTSGSSGVVDGMVNSTVDNLASREGVPAAFDNTINKDVDAEVNKFT